MRFYELEQTRGTITKHYFPGAGELHRECLRNHAVRKTFRSRHGRADTLETLYVEVRLIEMHVGKNRLYRLHESFRPAHVNMPLVNIGSHHVENMPVDTTGQPDPLLARSSGRRDDNRCEDPVPRGQ